MILCIFIALVAAAFADTSSPSPSSPHKCSHVDAAIESLQQSWDEEHGYTRPCGISSESCADGLIATWHSTFTSAGNARWNATRARLEFNNLMKGQWDNGFLPHVVFLDHFNASAHTRHSAASASVGRAGSLLLEQQSRPPYSNHSNNHSNHSNVPALKPVGSWVGLTPGPEWWDTNRATVRTSGIAAPPTQATVALQIYLYLWHEHPTGTTAHEFLYQAFIKVFNWHQYLHTRRDPDGNGMVYIRHPWESPLSWNASNVAATLQRANVTDLNKLAPNITVFPSSLIDLPGFPGNETYQKMLSIAACQSRLNWNEKKISTLSPVDLSSPCGFLVEDIAFNSLLLRADQDLNKIGMLLLQDKQEPEHNSDIINMQVTIQEWISAMESSTALGSPKIVRNLPKSDVSNGAVIISTDLSHPNASATDHFDVGALFPLMTANHISIGLANKLSTTALSPLFWTRYPLSESSFIEYQSSSNTKGEVVASKGGDERVSLPNNNCVRGGGNGNGNGNGDGDGGGKSSKSKSCSIGDGSGGDDGKESSSTLNNNATSGMHWHDEKHGTIQHNHLEQGRGAMHVNDAYFTGGYLKTTATQSGFFNAFKRGFHAYYSHKIFLASVAYTSLWCSVLDNGTLMTAYLLWRHVEPDSIGMWRGIGAIFGLIGTMLFPKLMKMYNGSYEKSGLVSIWIFWLLLAPGLIAFFISGESIASDYTVMVAMAVSRIGLWSFDLAQTQIMQTYIVEEERGLLNSTQTSMYQGFYVLMQIGGIIFHDPSQFAVLVYVSIFVVLGACCVYTYWYTKVSKRD